MTTLTPKDFLSRNGDEEVVNHERVRKLLNEGLFVSHTSKDHAFIQPRIIDIVYDQYGQRYFYHSRITGGAERYVELVRAALEYCTRFLVIVSSNSTASPWVKAEVEYAIRETRPIIQCIVDDCDPMALHPVLGKDHLAYQNKLYTIDFRIGIDVGIKRLTESLASPEFRLSLK